MKSGAYLISYQVCYAQVMLLEAVLARMFRELLASLSWHHDIS